MARDHGADLACWFCCICCVLLLLLLLLVVVVVVVVTRCSPYNDWPAITVRILCVGGVGGGVVTLLTMERVVCHHGADLVLLLLIVVLVLVVVVMTRWSPWNKWPATMVWILCAGVVVVDGGGGGTVGDSGLFCCVCGASFKH